MKPPSYFEKHLFKDIPHYRPQMKTLGLPKYQFTAREVCSGLMYLGFANEKYRCQRLFVCSDSLREL